MIAASSGEDSSNSQELETYAALGAIVAALDKRFPDGNSVFQRVSRLVEECGELAAVVNHRENTGIKTQKHGLATDEQLVKELQDVLRSTLGIARHYGVEAQLEQSIQEFYQAYKEQGRL